MRRENKTGRISNTRGNGAKPSTDRLSLLDRLAELVDRLDGSKRHLGLTSVARLLVLSVGCLVLLEPLLEHFHLRRLYKQSDLSSER